MKYPYLLFVMASLLFFFKVDSVSGFGSDRVRLEDVKVLTLKAGRMTTGRRSSPVPQMKCISNCNTLLPDSIQCTNRGWDGQSVQWECKADFQQGYRFGDLDVICEGYDYADDPYILAGSCGLEYSVRGSGNGGQQQSYGWQQDVLNNKNTNTTSDFQTIIFLVVVAIIIYAIYKTCIAGNNVDPTTAHSTTNNDYPPDDRQAPNMGWNVPGMGNQRGGGGLGFGDASCGAPGAGRRAGAGGGGGGFWTGLATGGFMGYMFGNRGGNQHRTQYYRQTPTGSSSFFSQNSFGGSTPSTTSTSTGFAGTRRR